MWLQALFFSMRTWHLGHSFVRAASQISVASSLFSCDTQHDHVSEIHSRADNELQTLCSHFLTRSQGHGECATSLQAKHQRCPQRHWIALVPPEEGSSAGETCSRRCHSERTHRRGT